MAASKLRIGVLGAGRWANMAHIPGWKRDPRVEVVALCDVEKALAQEMAQRFGIPEHTDDWQGLIARPDIDVIDIVTPSNTHQELAAAAVEAGKHVLSEKPVAHDFRETLRLDAEAKRKGLKTKLGFTFRHTPGVRYAKSLIDQGFVGRPFIFNGYEQNSQWLDPQTPLRRSQMREDQSMVQVVSLEGYGAPIIDIGRWWVGAGYSSVVGTMRNFIPERRVWGSDRLTPMNIDDGDVFVAEFGNGVIGSIQTSFVTIGNFPGVEARIFGDKGAIICRMVEEFGIAETIKLATPDSVEFKEVEIPRKFYPREGNPKESWRSLFYANLIEDFIDDILDGGDRNQGNFADGAAVQEVINAVELSIRQRRWVDLPLAGGA